MPTASSFDDLLARLQAEDGEAVREVFQRFGNRLIGLARQRLDGMIRRKVDAEEVVQSAFRSFFVRQAHGQFELRDWDSLWSLLVMITLRKCGRQVRRFRGPRRDVRKEVQAAVPDTSDSGWEAIAREPLPDEAAALAELVESIMRGLNDRERQVLELRLQGCSVPEISAQVGRTEYTIEGILKQIRKHLKHLRDKDGTAEEGS